MYIINIREELQSFLKDEILTSEEARKVLIISKQRMSQLLAESRIIPISKVGQVNLYWRKDVNLLKQELVRLRKKYRPQHPSE
ncbi:DNA-binding protein [Bacillus thuringiensis]|uniref:DNA-binding protein n=1 Tax=Bacillus thuringiensis TaxID=1428 RepID=UPI000BFC059B|nr:DNA-binding protein [Bacillus thuringiensis]EKS8366714.1 DNA-binding protein [Bacillus cereus]EKS8371551.1 DNA-binding protein [Bacillus cereus]MBG9504819.1 DNA-binding protein [Bacillus thuringiensis]MED3391732.1 DNA-binding protein [Bacillus thuringiensis]PGL26610.1 DNA-binding protein [Bacillus thuringiensis]